jgi:hypothetical protein
MKVPEVILCDLYQTRPKLTRPYSVQSMDQHAIQSRFSVETDARVKRELQEDWNTEKSSRNLREALIWD